MRAVRPAGAVRALAFVCVALVAAPAMAKRPAPAAHPAHVDVARQAAALDGADVSAAVAAAGALAKAHGRAALDALLNALALGLHPRVAAAALRAVGAHRAASAYDVVAYYLHHRDARVRAAAVTAIGAIGGRRATAPVLRALHDASAKVRAAAAAVVTEHKIRRAAKPLLALLNKGDPAAPKALAALADPELARVIAEQLGHAPDALLARCLGAILRRPDFRPDTARVEIVHALAKMPGQTALEQLTTYVSSVPDKARRKSRDVAEKIVDKRLGGS